MGVVCLFGLALVVERVVWGAREGKGVPVVRRALCCVGAKRSCQSIKLCSLHDTPHNTPKSPHHNHYTTTNPKQTHKRQQTNHHNPHPQPGTSARLPRTSTPLPGGAASRSSSTGDALPASKRFFCFCFVMCVWWRVLGLPCCRRRRRRRFGGDRKQPESAARERAARRIPGRAAGRRRRARSRPSCRGGGCA